MDNIQNFYSTKQDKEEEKKTNNLESPQSNSKVGENIITSQIVLEYTVLR